MIYKYCGLIVKSDLNFPFFVKSDKKPNIEIVQNPNFIILKDMPAVFLCDGKIIANFGEYGFYSIKKNKIECNFRDEKFIAATICNVPMAIIALLNGLLPIHSSAIVTNESFKAVLFIAKKGTGKSTLIYNLNRYLHYDILGDDMVSANLDSGKIYINRGTSMIKLCKDTLELNQCSKLSISDEVYYNWNKYYFSPNKYNVIAERYELKNIFIIERGNNIELVDLPEILHKAYIINNIVAMPYIADVLSKEINSLCNSIKIPSLKKLIIPNTLYNISESLEDIRQIIERC